jgi:Cdc6-like AAA superfamily ATPase
MTNELGFEKLRRQCDPNVMKCETTEEISPLKEIIGQKRALKALRFGLGIGKRDFNIFISGSPGTGRTTTVKNFLKELAKTKPIPSDWCYVNNFSNPYEPRAISLPAGKGRNFQAEITRLIEEVKSALPKAFESEEYSKRREVTTRRITSDRNELFSKTSQKAQKEGFVLQSSPIGFTRRY